MAEKLRILFGMDLFKVNLRNGEIFHKPRLKALVLKLGRSQKRICIFREGGDIDGSHFNQCRGALHLGPMARDQGCRVLGDSKKVNRELLKRRKKKVTELSEKKIFSIKNKL